VGKIEPRIERVPDALAGAEVRTPEGEAVRLGNVWRDRTAVLAFVRHFG
jgi:hypothetical protein